METSHRIGQSQREIQREVLRVVRGNRYAREGLLPSLDGDVKRRSRRSVSVQLRGHPFPRETLSPQGMREPDSV